MSFYEICMLKELLLKDYDSKSIEEKRLIDKEFRKEIITKYHIVTINAIEQCISDKARITSEKDYKTYKEREYDTDYIYPNEVIMKEHLQKYGYLVDTRLEEYIYYNSSIPYIYHLEYLEFINGYKEEERLAILNLIYPAKMPKKNYFPFIEFEIGTKIPIMLTEEEKEKYKESLDDFSNYKIEESSWNYCILWIDKDRVFMSLICDNYYFKQVGKNVHLFKLIYQCV